MANEEWRINTQLRLGLPLASYHNKPHEPCPHGCRHPQSNERVKVRYGYHLVTDCRKANQGNKSHKDVESILIHYFNTFTHITATKAKPFPNCKQAVGLIGHHDHRQPNLQGLVIKINDDHREKAVDPSSREGRKLISIVRRLFNDRIEGASFCRLSDRMRSYQRLYSGQLVCISTSPPLMPSVLPIKSSSTATRSDTC